MNSPLQTSASYTLHSSGGSEMVPHLVDNYDLESRRERALGLFGLFQSICFHIPVNNCLYIK